MRIKYMLLENFSIVKGAMGLNKLELDFTGHDNRITLIIGSNGSGKTGGILANLHPYAGLGHLEEREDSDLIVPGKKGHKQIIFTTKKHEYVIDHFYTWQGADKSRKISSYCKKDGVELNKTGLVTTFNVLIESEFGIDINFLKLMRLGPNVVNFIKLSTNERKSYMTKLMREIDDFIKDQKKVAERSALLNNALRIAMDKKRKLNVEDLTLLDEEISKKENKVDKLKKDKELAIQRFFAYKGSVDSVAFEKFDYLVDKYRRTLIDLKNEYDNLQQPKYVHIEQKGESTLETYNNDLSNLNDTKNKLTSELAILRSRHFMIEDKIRNIEERIAEVNKENVDIATSDKADKELELVTYLTKLEKEIADYEEMYKGKLVPSATKIELNSDIDLLHMILFHIQEINAYSEDSITLLGKLYTKYGLDMDKIYAKLQKKSKETSYAINQLTNRDEDDIVILFLPEECEHWKECPYYQYGKMKCKIENKEAKLETLIVKQRIYEEVNMILGSLTSIRKILSLRKVFVPEYEVTEKGIVESIIFNDMRYFVDENVISNLMIHIEDYEIYTANIANRDKTKTLLKRLVDTNKYIKELEGQRESYFVELSQLKDVIAEKMEELKPVNCDIDLLQKMISDYNVFVQLSMNKLRIESSIREVKSELNKLKQMEDAKREYDKKESEYKEEMSYYAYTINQEETELYNLRKKKSLFNELEKEIEEIQRFYEYVELIKKSVSNKEGIPKEYVIYYCRALRNIANEIIKDIYGGDLELDVFEITDSKFNIPYITKGVRVEDIKYASQAEVSIATIALSFAILFQFLPKYNIILLDEIDGPLHSKNKDKLFASLESHLDKIGCEQLFWITQSKMYNDYPVNLIITDPEYSANTFSNKSSIIFQR